MYFLNIFDQKKKYVTIKHFVILNEIPHIIGIKQEHM